MPPAAAFIASAAGARRAATIERGKAAAAAGHEADADDADDADAGASSGAGAGASASADELLATGVDRALLLSVLKARRRRAAQCRSLPPAVLFYAIYILAMCTHVSVPASFDVERG